MWADVRNPLSPVVFHRQVTRAHAGGTVWGGESQESSTFVNSSGKHHGPYFPLIFNAKSVISHSPRGRSPKTAFPHLFLYLRGNMKTEIISESQILSTFVTLTPKTGTPALFAEVPARLEIKAGCHGSLTTESPPRGIEPFLALFLASYHPPGAMRCKPHTKRKLFSRSRLSIAVLQYERLIPRGEV
jgi:hypothetical protein